MPRLDLSQIPFQGGSSYPGKLAEATSGRFVQRIGDASGLTQSGINIVRIEPGGLSSLRHYHMQQDEFLVMLSGALTLIDDDGEHEMLPGDCASFPAGEANGGGSEAGQVEVASPWEDMTHLATAGRTTREVVSLTD